MTEPDALTELFCGTDFDGVRLDFLASEDGDVVSVSLTRCHTDEDGSTVVDEMMVTVLPTPAIESLAVALVEWVESHPQVGAFEVTERDQDGDIIRVEGSAPVRIDGPVGRWPGRGH